MAEPLYDSKELQAIYHKGKETHGSRVFFSGALIDQGQTPPWAQATFSRWQGDTILICPRDKGYFAPDLVRPLLACLPALRKPVIVMGSSMGGYAALKYSRFLSADAVLAFSPQFAVSPHEAPFDPNRHAFYNIGLHGNMAIKNEDIGGKVSVFYDPENHTDKLHAQAIHAAVPTANLVPALYTGHHLIRIFSDEPKLAIAVRYTLTKPAQELRRAASKIKKNSSTYYINLATALQKRGKNRAALEIIDAAAARFGTDRHILFCKARILRRDRKIEDAYACFKIGFEMSRRIPEYEDLALGGNLAVRLDLKDEAVRFFKMAVERNPFKPSHYLVYIDELIRQGLRDDGIAATTAALQRFPDHPALLERLGKLKHIRGLGVIARFVRRVTPRKNI